MIVDDKKRVIGKIIAINSDRFTVELLSGQKNFNVNGFDDIHYFAQINSYVVVPYQNYYIVSEIVSIREKDSNSLYSTPKEQELSKSQSIKQLDVLPIGMIKKSKKENKPEFVFGASVYPTLYSDVLYIKDDELDTIFNVSTVEESVDGTNSRLNALKIGKSAIFQDYDIKVDINKFFGAHSAVLGNTGSGKSCTIASILQTLFSKQSYSAVGANFIFFDVNGEYKQAFEQLNSVNDEINIHYTSIEDTDNPLILPHRFLNIDEWELLLQASEKAQLPILRNALGLATIFSNTDENGLTLKIKNHILASCILESYNSSDSPVSKHQKIQSLFVRGSWGSYINIKGYSGQYGNFSNVELENQFLDTMRQHILEEGVELSTTNDSYDFKFELLGEALDIAILYEEAHGNRQIRNFCSSLITRFKTLNNRVDFNFLKTEHPPTSKVDYLSDLFGLEAKIKRSQITIIDLNACEDEVIEIITSVLTRIIFESLRKLEPRNALPVNLVLEEAHRYISQEFRRNFLSANKIFERVAKEGRKYGLFFTVSSQRPSELSKTVLSQCSNFIVHRIQNPDDLSHIRQITPHISESTLKKLPSIPTQHALIFGSSVNIPALFKVNDANPLPNSDNNKISENWFVPSSHKFEVKI